MAGVAFAAAAAGESLITPRLRETPAWSGSGTWLVVLNAGAWLFLLLNLVAVRQAARGHGLGHLDGLIERLFLLCVLGWLAAAAAGLVRGRGAGARPAGPCG